MVWSTAPTGTISQIARGFRELLGELRQRGGADGLLLDHVAHRVCGPVEHHALVAALQETAHHVGSHPAEADHSQLHRLASRRCCVGSTCIRPAP